MRGLGLALAIAAAGCGGSTNSGGGNSQGPATFSGGFSGTAQIGVIATYTSVNNLLGIALETTESTGPELIGSLSINGSSGLSATTYTASSTNTGMITLNQTANSTNSWAAEVSGGIEQGSFSITISSTGNSISNGGTSVWTQAHGTFTATMPAQSSGTATGTVNVSGTF